MTLDNEDLLNSIMASLDRISNIKSKDMPNIDLYMDQVTTFMESKLKSATRNPGEDKVLTKTMINNYAKNDLLPPPDKKKYTKEHIIMLIFIFYSKGMLSISDIQTMLNPLSDNYFGKGGEFGICDIYDEVFSMENELKGEIKEDISKKFERALNTFEDCPKKDKEMLQMFSLLFMLGYDVYTKKLLMEKLLDSFSDMTEDKSPKKGKDSKKK